MSVKERVLPMGPRVRRLPVGIGRGLRLELDFRHHTRLYLGLYEIELNRHLRRLSRRARGAFDVGGHLGYDALVLAKLVDGPIVSFEADPGHCAVMSRAFAANGPLGERIEPRCQRVGAGGTGTVSLDEVAFASDGFVPDVVKVDVEGAESDVLRGAERLLGERRPGLIVEIHSAALEAECAALLGGHGYRVRTVRPRRWLADLRPVDHNAWLVAEA